MELMDMKRFPRWRMRKTPTGRAPARDHAAAHWTVFFHPDYDRRLRHWTGSADLPAKAGSARGLACRAFSAEGLPPVGSCTPPWRRYVCAGEPARGF